MTKELLPEDLESQYTFDDEMRSKATHGHTHDQQSGQPRSLDHLLANLDSVADEIAYRQNSGSVAAPLGDMRLLSKLGLLTAPLPANYGGFGLGTECLGFLPLLRVMTVVGGADLVLGRLYEGHVNALILIASYGSELQLARAADDAAKGMLFGVWNTGEPAVLQLDSGSNGITYAGAKVFASGAGFVCRPIVTAEVVGKGWQMTLPRMESVGVSSKVKIDETFWNPLGMEGSASYRIDFTGAQIGTHDLIGLPGDFYRDPLFHGGAVRFAAVQAGAVIRLHRLFAEWLQEKGRGNDPYQIARLGEIAIETQSAILWIERAAFVSDECLWRDAGKLATERMVDCANSTRAAIEEIATSVLQKVVAGVGAHGLLRPHPFEKIVRNLTMYLRQPAPDRNLAEVGRNSLRKSNLRASGTENFMWRTYARGGSLPSRYFEEIYRASKDPWNFETSGYETSKYKNTLDLIPFALYARGLEIGSSIGVFTQLLANRCEALISVDISEDALEIARTRCRKLTNVRFLRAQLPYEIPPGRHNLILISEVAYYWSLEDLETCASLLAKHQSAGDHLVLVHLTVPVPDYPLTGDEVHDAWLMRPEWISIMRERHDKYRIDVLERSEHTDLL